MRQLTLFQFAIICCVQMSFAACGSDMSSGNQLIGQSCFVTSDCAGELICYDRQCASRSSAPILDMGRDLSSDLTSDQNNQPDLDGPCVVDSAYCADEATLLRCVVGPMGGTFYEPSMCNQPEVCIGSACVVAPDECVDSDSDGYFAGRDCPVASDCDDDDPLVSPGESESCDTPYDDNCNGQINEGCEECCSDCGDNQFCSTTQCGCVDYDPGFCSSQDQPCDVEGQVSNGYVCATFDGEFAPHCFGTCQVGNNDSCPDPGSVCAFGENGQGICLSACTLAQGCGSEILGCLPFGSSTSQGVCLPSNPGNPVGSECSLEVDLDCASGALCIPNEATGRGECVAACRPFAHVSSSTNPSDCISGSHCLPFSTDIGVCAMDNGSVEGNRCSPQGSTCDADAVGCYPGAQGNQCTRICRLGQSGDCGDRQRCRPYDMQERELGYCGSSF